MKKILILPLLFIAFQLHSQWNNRYPKVDGYGHHVYLEAFELPVMNGGPTDPAPSPDGKQLAFASKGYLWILDLSTGTAKQVTSSSDVDARPNWSPDGEWIAFVRDNSLDTRIMLLHVTSGEVTDLVNTEKMELDPIFSSEGDYVYYSSASNGSFDIWRIDLSTRAAKNITDRRSLERLPVPLADGKTMLYLKKQGFSYDHIEKMDLATGKYDTLVADNFVSQASFTLSPDQRTIAYTWPYIDRYDIRLIDLERPTTPLILTKANGLPLTPKFSADGQWIYFTEFNQNERAELFRISVNGGKKKQITVKDWQWQQPMQTLQLNTFVGDQKVPVRLHVTDANGHPVIPENTTVHSEGQHGLVFFYSTGEVELTVPLGTLHVSGVHGFETPVKSVDIEVTESTTSADIRLESLWDAGSDGWIAGDNHFHLNYGGAYQLSPEDILPEMRGEGMDVAFPLVANIHNRYLEENLFGWTYDQDIHVQFGQEVRSHFLGHLNLIGTDSLFWPWIWGPRYDVYGRDDRPNAEAVQFARVNGGLAGYVHPVGNQQPFTEEGARGVPIELVADCVLGECDMIEVACLWTDEIGTAAIWHELLNLGIPVALSAGSDVMNDYYRTMSIGATRLYVKPDGALSTGSYLEAMKEGKSFVTNGPLLNFHVDGLEPGGILPDGNQKASWTLDVHAPVAVEKVEIFVNGEIVWSKDWKGEAGTQTYKGNLNLPEGGWITARVSGGESVWPMMDSYPFAETSPLWIGSRGSAEDAVRKAAAEKLLLVLQVSEERLKAGYGDAEIPRLEATFSEARRKLESLRQGGN